VQTRRLANYRWPREIYETSFDEDVSNDNTACPECDGQVRTNAVETVCEDCGLVIDEQKIDHGPEWRSFEDHGRTPNRTGAPLTVARHDRGLSTEIGRRTDANGNEVSGHKRQRLARMRREQTRGRFQSKAERNLAHGLGEVRRIASVLELSGSVRDQACQLFRSAQTEDLLRGRSIEAIAAASIYGACRCNGHSRLLDDVVDAARVEQSRVTNAYKALNTELGLPTQPVRPSEFIPSLRQNSIFQRTSDSELGGWLNSQNRQEQWRASSHPDSQRPVCTKAGREEGRWLTQAEVAAAASVTATTLRSHRDTLNELAV